ncbi:MAG: M36 family metallopeptidase [Bacteroidota bacterium]
MTSVKAVELAARELGLTTNGTLRLESTETTPDRRQVLSDGGISEKPIEAKLVYMPQQDGRIALTWNLRIRALSGEHSWDVFVDANDGRIVRSEDLMFRCGSHEHSHPEDHENETHDPLYEKESAIASNQNEMRSGGPATGTYEVFEFPLESPFFGSRTVVTDVYDTTASPYGWHDTNGSPGAEYTITRGNNVYAYESGDNPGFSPNGGASLEFFYPLNLIWTPGNQSEAAAITNAFYWTNVLHDIAYRHGFDEASGNHQVNNYGNGGVGGDPMEVKVQISSGCGPTWSPEVEGVSPVMNLRIGGAQCPIPAPVEHDNAFDNLAIAHEYAHGIGFRLVGGPYDIYAYVNPESPTEGVSDWFGMITTMEPGAVSTDPRTIGTWILADETGPGFRDFPYSTDMTVNPKTYADLGPWSAGGFHRVGQVYAAVLWEMTWNLIDVHGFDPDFHTGTGGNNIAIELVIEALKLVPSEPGLVDFRDAVLQADMVLNNSANNCLIWQAFAKRGVGLSADQGTTSGVPTTAVGDETEAFDMPSYCSCTQLDLVIDEDVNPGWIDFQEATNTILATNVIFNDGRAEYNAGDSVTLGPGFHAQSGSDFLAYIETCSGLNQKAPRVAYEEIETIGMESSDGPAEHNFAISPNPTNGVFDLKGTHSMATWELSNHMGRVFAKGELNDQRTTSNQINIQHLPTGLYFVCVVFKDGTTRTKQLIRD